jgi:hypothetical protein
MPGQRPGPIEHTTIHLPTHERRVGGSIVLAMVVHGAIALALLGALDSPHSFDWLVLPRSSPDTTIERVRYVELGSVDPAPTVTPPHASPVSPAIDQPSPATLPDATPTDGASTAAPPFASPTVIDSRFAALTDSGRPTTGVTLRPGSADPRIWSAAGRSSAPLSISPSTTAARFDATAHAGVLHGTLARGIAASNDSIAALGVQTVRPDWVTTHGDHSYGMDNTSIHLGKVSVPAVLLGLLPINGFGCMPTMYFPDRAVRDSVGISCIQLENPTVADRNERIAEMSTEIRARAPLTLAGREEVARIATRKDREHDARTRASRSTARPP